MVVESVKAPEFFFVPMELPIAPDERGLELMADGVAGRVALLFFS